MVASYPVLRLDYGDHEIDILDGVNNILKPHGLMFEDDGLEHDGYMIWTLKPVEPKD